MVGSWMCLKMSSYACSLEKGGPVPAWDSELLLVDSTLDSLSNCRIRRERVQSLKNLKIRNKEWVSNCGGTICVFCYGNCSLVRMALHAFWERLLKRLELSLFITREAWCPSWIRVSRWRTWAAWNVGISTSSIDRESIRPSIGDARSWTRGSWIKVSWHIYSIL